MVLKSFIGKLIKSKNPTYRDRTVFKYDVSIGKKYALKYAKNSPYFYNSTSLGGDCTNFVSQCVWAAYGGYIPNDKEKTMKNIAAKVRMVPNLWHANKYGATKAWANVESFFNFVTDGNKDVGPLAESYGGGILEKIPPSMIKVGDVLQFKKHKSRRCSHTVYVTDVGSGNYYDEIFICQHSPNIKNRPLLDVVKSFGGYDTALVRGLHFKAANFTS